MRTKNEPLIGFHRFPGLDIIACLSFMTAMTIIVVGNTAISKLVPVAVGRSFTMALRGTKGSLTSFKAQWYDGANWNNFVSTDLDLADAGEAIGVNVGSINEIRIVSTGNGSTDMRAVINTIPDGRAIM